MGILDRFRKTITTRFAAGKTQNQDPNVSVPEFGGSRQSIPTFRQTGGGFGGLPKRTQAQLQVTEASLRNANLNDIVSILVDAHPDLSYAVWNFLRLGNTGYKITVKKPGSDKPFTQGDKIIQEFLDRIESPNLEAFTPSRGMNKLLNQLMLSVITRGACSLELVLGVDKTTVAFLAPIDPATIDFKFENDRYVPFAKKLQQNIDIPTFFYETFDAMIDDPYGRSPIWASINMVLFQLQILADIKAVVHNQGYPRFDIKILEEVLLQRMPISIRNNEQEKQKWLNEKLKEIIEMYQSLDADDTFVHFDSIEIGMAGGKGGGGGALIDPEKLMTAIDNLVMTGLKTLSTILGRRSTGNTESFAKIEIKLYTQGIKAIQECVERTMSRALTMMLNISGKQGIVSFKFNEAEIRSELEQQQFEQIRLLNIAYLRDQGWIDQDEASMRAVGKPSVSEPLMNAEAPKNKDGGTPKGNPDTVPSS